MDWTINRFSSRRQPLDRAFLAERLKNAKSYKRIAGYFRSSLFELVGEEIANIPDVRMVCNSDLDPADIAVSKAAREALLQEKWNAPSPEVEALLRRQQYRKLYELLTSGRVQVRVVPRNKTFLHGKAGVIETPEGKTCFLGSVNETRSAFSESYEILWEDTSCEGVSWVEEEFEALWKESYPLPDGVVEEVKRIADRVEVRIEDVDPADLPGAVFVEAPVYRGGEQLQPWQRSFVTMFLQHREAYGKARLLLADEVGLGKTLSLAAAAVLAILLGDGPVLVLCPSNLTLQWQVEIKDRLGLPSAVWRSIEKVWADPDGRVVSGKGAQYVTKCPFQTGIVSTGLIFHNSDERAALLEERFGTVVLDEAHRARRRGALGEPREDCNNLLSFMQQMGERAQHVFLGTATPIQTQVYELWDLLKVLNSGVDFVLGRELVSRWAHPEKALSYVKGSTVPPDEREAWELVRNPLPPGSEGTVFAILRNQLGLGDKIFFCNRAYGDLDYPTQETIRQTMDAEFLKSNNPIVRHTVVRRRRTLEEQGFLERIAVNVHPDPWSSGPSRYPGQVFVGQALLTNHPFRLAYEAAENFIGALSRRTRAAGLLKAVFLQRICSSFASGKSTAQRLLQREVVEEIDDDSEEINKVLEVITREECDYLQTIVEELSRPEARDPKLGAVKYFLKDYRTDGRTWLEHGCIVFSQYYDTVKWIASELTAIFPDEPIAVYAGSGRSGLFSNMTYNATTRADIKKAVKDRELRLVVATDAACEGLNLQTLGTLINVDLPWNPARLEQRLGRIKRLGQSRKTVDILNLVYHETQDEKVYETLSKRFRDRYEIFGDLPDTIDDDWIADIERFEEMVDKYIHLREKARNAFQLRYQSNILPDVNRWELCSRVLARSDILERVSKPW